MDITTVSQVISSVGFPIVMCIMLFVQMVKELNSLKDCINNNTQVLTQLVAKLEMELEKEENENGKN